MSFWTDVRISEFRDRYHAGESFGVIAEAMGTSRNAVIGKAHRLKLPERTVSRDINGFLRRPQSFDARKPSVWAPEEISKLIRGITLGHSWGRIAQAVGRTEWVCANRARAMGLKKRSAAGWVGGVPQPRKLAPARPRPSLRPDVAEPESRRLSLTELSDAVIPTECRYIKGEDYLYCGHPVWGSSSYCEHHHRLVWKPGEGYRERVAQGRAA